MKLKQLVKNFSIKHIHIKPCEKGVINCMCVNYLDFKNKYHYDVYKKCLHIDDKKIEYKHIF
jgi:hypothetical protein